MKRQRVLPFLGIGAVLAGAVGGGLLIMQQSARAAKNDRSVWTPAEIKAIAAYRAEGQAGLDRLMQEKSALLSRIGKGDEDKEAKRMREMLDAVAQQKDSVSAGLYWYTDLDAAKKAAASKNLPILSLRLLGKLTDERSCANSRFFRSVLYPNAKLGAFLKQNFILHWSSERPVPLVTIDYGDGRRIETTLTGNSIHYILTADGTPIDALPGLYSPTVFQYRLQVAKNLADTVQHLPIERRTAWLKSYHQSAIQRLSMAWQREGGKAELLLAKNAPPAENNKPVTENAAPEVVRAEMLTMTKSDVEIPVLAKLLPEHLAPEKIIKSDKIWEKIAETRLLSENPLDANCTALMRRKLAHLSEAEFQKVLATFRKQIVIDSTRNDYVLHRQLHQWMMETPALDFTMLNTRIYADLFLTPASDPWLGLLMEGQYTGLPDGGVIQPEQKSQQKVVRR